MPKRVGRAIRQGNESLVMTLPRDWVRGVQLAKGDALDVTYDDETVHVRPLRKKIASSAGRNPGAPARRPAPLVETDEKGLADARR